MANPISGLLDGMNPMGQLMGMAQAIQSGNPLAMMSQNDPRMKQVSEFISQCGGDPQQAFMQLAKQRGADPDAILGQVRTMFGLK